MDIRCTFCISFDPYFLSSSTSPYDFPSSKELNTKYRPNFVVVTGDLTDAKDVRRITSQQYLEEWLVYKQAIAEGVPEGMPWYDMRGNHDCFDLPSWQSRANLYRTYGASAQRVQDGQGIYTWQLENSFGRYRFVAIDAW